MARRAPPRFGWFFATALLILGSIPVARAAPELTLNRPFVKWQPSMGDLAIDYRSRREIQTLTLRILRLDGTVVYRDERFNLLPGLAHWRWDGVLPGGGRISPGQYRIVLEAHLDTGAKEVERGDLRVLPGRPEAKARTSFAPPPAPYEAPPYELTGRLGFFRRHDNSLGQEISDFRSTTRLREAGAHHLLDLNLDYFRRTGGISNFDNSAGRVKTFWNSGGVDLVFRRSLGDFDDPLRLFADFRSQHDKRGIRIDQRLGKIRVIAIGLRGYPGRGAEHGQAARLTGQVTQGLEVGLSYARRNLNQAPFASLDSRVGGLDLRWRVSGRQQWAFEHAISQASGDAPVQPRGTGRGDRLSWSYRMDNGLSTRLGYLDLSPDYNAAFSDPGNQILSHPLIFHQRSPKAFLKTACSCMRS